MDLSGERFFYVSQGGELLKRVTALSHRETARNSYEVKGW